MVSKGTKSQNSFFFGSSKTFLSKKFNKSCELLRNALSLHNHKHTTLKWCGYKKKSHNFEWNKEYGNKHLIDELFMDISCQHCNLFEVYQGLTNGQIQEHIYMGKPPWLDHLEVFGCFT
jgi:hypothetical protein